MAIRALSCTNSYYSAKYEINSFSDPTKIYIVSETTTGEWQCSCPVWIYRRRTCKHIENVQQYLQSLKKVKIPATPKVDRPRATMPVRTTPVKVKPSQSAEEVGGMLANLFKKPR